MSPGMGGPTSASPEAAGPSAWLREQQRAFAAAVTAQGPVDRLLADSPNGGPPLIGAYRFAYGARLTEALQDNHEILARAMGDESFAALAEAYREAHPPTEPSIRWFGHRLAEFMARCVAADEAADQATDQATDEVDNADTVDGQAAADAPSANRAALADAHLAGLVPHPAFVDLARMDWALRTAFDAADGPSLGRAALAGLAPEHFADLRFTLHPSVQLQPMDWAVEAAWRLLREHDPESGDDEPELPEPEARSHTLLVWRRGLDTLWRSLDDTETALLQALAEGASFGTLCEVAAAHSEQEDQAAQCAAGALAQWLDDGLLMSC